MQRYRSIRPENSGVVLRGGERLRRGGVYLITGGLGKIGLCLAEYLSKEYGGRMVLTGRSEFPGTRTMEEVVGKAWDEGNTTSTKIGKLQKIEAMGGQVLVLRADASDEKEMRRAFKEAEKRFGEINGVIHAAGVPQMTAIQEMSLEKWEEQFRGKVFGLLVLKKGIREGRKLDFLLCDLITFVGIGRAGIRSLCRGQPVFGQFRAAGEQEEQFSMDQREF